METDELDFTRQHARIAALDMALRFYPGANEAVEPSDVVACAETFAAFLLQD